MIRKATNEDIEVCSTLTDIPELHTASGEPISSDYFSLHVGSDFFLVYEEEGKVKGFVLAEKMKGPVVFLHNLVVDASLRGKGIGSDLFSEVVKQVKTLGASYLYLIALKSNEKTLHFYEKQGMVKGHEYVLFDLDL